MRVFVMSKDGVPLNTNSYAAWLGFREMGYETVPYEYGESFDSLDRGDLVVGGLGSCQRALARFGIDTPVLNYPEELRGYLGRRVWMSTMDTICGDMDAWPVFVKPVQEKFFTGKVIGSIGDLVGCGESGRDHDVFCSEPKHFVAEWRCFVRYGRILDVRPYKGDWRLHFNPNVIDEAIAAYAGTPAGYGADFGLTDDGETLLVEINDGYAMGSYGLQHNLYAQLLSARWSELCGVEDELGYIRA